MKIIAALILLGASALQAQQVGIYSPNSSFSGMYVEDAQGKRLMVCTHDVCGLNDGVTLPQAMRIVRFDLEYRTAQTETVLRQNEQLLKLIALQKELIDRLIREREASQVSK